MIIDAAPRVAVDPSERFFRYAVGLAALAVAGAFGYGLVQSTDFYQRLSSVGTAFGALFAGVGILYAALQLRATKKIARGDFLLHVDEIFQAHHRQMYLKFRRGGPWAEKTLSTEELSEMVLYAGLFERIKVYMDSGIVDARTVYQLYGYRIKELLGNRSVCRYILNEHRRGWTKFIELCEIIERLDRRLGAERRLPSLRAEDHPQPMAPAS